MSNAVGNERISRIVGYKLTKGDFSETSPNLPQRIAVLGEANEANQVTLDVTPWEFTSLKAVGERYGYGSPLYNTMRILKPVASDGVGGIPIVLYPQAKAVGAAARVQTLTPTGPATKSGVHTVVVAGRYGVDGASYDIKIVSGDTVAIICDKIVAALNAVLGCPVIAVDDTTHVTLTAKWNGLTSQGISVTVDTKDDALGLTYAVAQTTAGSGTPSIDAALNLFGSQWNTIVVNTYGMVAAVMTSLETFNGKPDPENPTGRFAGVIMKPFIAITGSVDDNPSATTDAKLDENTIAIAPAPLSAGLPMEAAANMALLFARRSQDAPHLDIAGLSYPDMPTPENIGTMAVYDNRDAYVKKGCSTVDLIGGRYQVQDFVTTYHPVGENPPQFRYCRNLMLDFNVRYSYYLLEQINVVDHAIANDADVVTAGKVIKPKQWKAILDGFADDLSLRALIVDKAFMQNSIDVKISSSNPDRLETFFRYKRSGVARISSTTAEAGFNFGTLN